MVLLQGDLSMQFNMCIPLNPEITLIETYPRELLNEWSKIHVQGIQSASFFEILTAWR